MPLPRTYAHASKDWRAFLDDAKERLDLQSDNMAYTAVDGVLQVFRRRLRPDQAIAFADVLPAVLRAIFLYQWEVTAPPVPFAPRPEMAAEAMAVRRNHNLTPPTCIEAVAWALRRHVRQLDLDRVLAGIGPEAEAFWQVDAASEGYLTRRLV